VYLRILSETLYVSASVPLSVFAIESTINPRLLSDAFRVV
jgi:hypothetical protein